MRSASRHLACLLLMMLLVWSAGVSPARAGITVTSYSTSAGVNAFAPVGGTQYIEQEVVANTSPAVAEASGNWTGPNAGGSTATWHYVGSAQATSTTAYDADSLSVTAAGSFSYEITTTADFVDPSSSSIFTPGAVGSYNGFFNTDVSTIYAITAHLNRWSRVRLNSLDGSVVFDHSNHTAIPMTANFSGTIPPGEYRVLIGVGVGAPNLPNGVNHYETSGSFDNVTFTVQVPEPSSLGALIAIALCRRGRRTR